MPVKLWLLFLFTFLLKCSIILIDLLPCAEERLYFMNEKEYIKEFFENPYSIQYLDRFNEMLRMAVTAVTASCEYAEQTAAANGSALEPAVFDEVWEQCRRLMRTSELITAVMGGFAEQCVINAEELLSSISAGCKELIGDKYNIIVTGECGGYVRGNDKVIKYILLSVIRSIVLDTPGELVDIELSVAKNDDEVRMLLRCDRDVDINKGTMIKNDSDALNEILAQRLGGRFISKPDGCELVLPSAKPDGTLNSPPALQFGDGGRYSTFNIMLRWITEENAL